MMDGGRRSILGAMGQRCVIFFEDNEGRGVFFLSNRLGSVIKSARRSVEMPEAFGAAQYKI